MLYAAYGQSSVPFPYSPASSLTLPPSYTNPPKYRCPSCPTIRTCSLPCYKRHQQRATCTGRRNESSYVKKSALSTPAGLDHDYNFLTKIERALSTPPSSSSTTTSSDPPPAKRRKLAAVHPGFAAYLAEHRITLHRAPPGLHRAKTNQSRFLPKSRKVAWTVEWICGGADWAPPPRVSEVLSDTSVGDAYASMAARAAKLERKEGGGGNSEARASTAPAVSTTEPGADAEAHLYLLRPRTLSSIPVLAPLDPAKSLTAALEHTTLDEYPTVYALPFAPAALPKERFTLVEAYDKHIKAELAGLDREEVVRQVDKVLGGKTGWAAQEDKEGDKDEARWDEKRVLEMLRRDVDLRR